MFDGIGLPEILLILVIIMIFFGVGKLPEVASGLGKAVRNFRKAQRGEFDEEGKTTTIVKVTGKVTGELPSGGAARTAK